MSITTNDRNYAEAKIAQNFFRDAVDFSLKGNVAELRTLVTEYLAKNTRVTSEDLLVDFKSEGKTLLHVAASGGHAAVVDYLITLLKSSKVKKTLINAADDRGFTPLINATVSESDVIMSTLLQNGAEVNSVNKDGAGAIHFAAGDGSIQRLTILTNVGAAIQGMSQSGTPLHWAAGKGRTEAIKFLAEKGCDLDMISSQGLSAVLMAAVSSCDDGVAYLVEKGADVGQIVRGNATVLHICAEHGLKLAVAAIIKTENGKKCCEIQTEDGNLPVHLAGMAGHKDIVNMLLPLSSQTINCTVDQILEDGVHRMAAWTDRANAHSEELKAAEEKAAKESARGDRPVVISEPQTPAASPEAEAESEFWKRRGNEAFVSKDYKKAEEAYTKAIVLKGDNGSLWSNRSACYLVLGESYAHKALADAEICRRLMPAWPKACFRLAKARLALKMYEEAAVAAFEGCKLDDANIDLKNLLRECVAQGKEDHQRKIASGEIPIV